MHRTGCFATIFSFNYYTFPSLSFFFFALSKMHLCGTNRIHRNRIHIRARNSGLPMAKMQAKIQVWQAEINLNCQTENKMACEIYWTGVVSFSSPLTLLLYLLFLSMNQSSLMKKILLKRNSFDCKTLH